MEEEREGRNGRGGGANKDPAVASEKGSMGGGWEYAIKTNIRYCAWGEHGLGGCIPTL